MVSNLSTFSKNLFSMKGQKKQSSNTLSLAPDAPSEEDVHVAISPLLDFLNVNLGTISEYTSLLVSRRLVSGIWSRFVTVSESVLVPGLTDDGKRVWEDARVMFLRNCVEVSTFKYQLILNFQQILLHYRL
jgi:hypothetical protein